MVKFEKIFAGWFLEVFFRSYFPLSAVSFFRRTSSKKDAASIGAKNPDLLCQSLKSLTKFFKNKLKKAPKEQYIGRNKVIESEATKW